MLNASQYSQGTKFSFGEYSLQLLTRLTGLLILLVVARSCIHSEKVAGTPDNYLLQGSSSVCTVAFEKRVSLETGTALRKTHHYGRKGVFSRVVRFVSLENRSAKYTCNV